MKVLVCPHNLNIGGTQLNSVDLAAAVRDRGHQVMVCGGPGPLRQRVSDLELRLIVPEHRGPGRLGDRAFLQLARIARREAVDVVHAWEDVRTRQAFFGPHLLHGIPVLSTIMSMGLPRSLPRTIPITVGTRELLGQARDQRRPFVELLEPPVDTREDRPGPDDGTFRAEFSLTDDKAAVVAVSRLSHTLKLEGLLAAIEAVTQLAFEMPVRLVIVGDGPARPILEERAREARRSLGTDVVVLTGPLLDPRPAYSMADVVLGMGSSALRGMAFGKPVIVLGEEGFCEIVEPATFAHFEEHGMYGLGTGPAALPGALIDRLRRLLSEPRLRETLGRYSRQMVCERYSLEKGSLVLEAAYERAARARGSLPRRLPDAVRTAWFVLLDRGSRSETGRQGRKPLAVGSRERPAE